MEKYIQVNNKKMEVLHKGKEGVPILILTGMACSFEEWHEITDALSTRDQVIMFHRPGLGNSEIGIEKRSTAQVCKEITCLLSILNVTEPILLIGHSYGGLIAQHYAKMHPGQVKAMILVDSTSEDLEKLNELDLPVLNENASDEEWIESCKVFAEMTEAELKTVLKTELSESQRKLPKSIQPGLIDFQHNPNLFKAMKSEVANWKEDSSTIKRLGSLGQMPLIVIGRDKSHMIKIGLEAGLPEEELILLESLWQDLIKNQAKLSAESKLLFAENAGHSVYLDSPELVIQSVAQIKRKIKEGA